MTHLIKPHPARQRRGFSLIEVLGILAVLGVLAVGAVSVIPDSNASLTTETDQLSTHLRYTQIRAQADTYEWRLVFTSSTTYRIGPMVLHGIGFTPQIIPGTGAFQRTLTDGVTVPAGTIIRFDSWGRPLNASGNLVFADQIITLTKGAKTQTLTVRGQTGLIP